MRSVLLAGAMVAAVLTALGVVGAVLEIWWLVVGAALVLLSLTLLAAIDADRRVRALRAFIRQEVRRTGKVSVKNPTPAAPAPPVTEADLTGAVQLLQAQYVGRLDRMQGALDQAVARLRTEGPVAQPTAKNEQA